MFLVCCIVWSSRYRRCEVSLSSRSGSSRRNQYIQLPYLETCSGRKWGKMKE